MPIKQRTVIFFILAIPFSLQILWQFINQTYPIGDPGSHYRIANLIYLAFEESFYEGIYFLFHTGPGGKPVLFPAFATPFIPLSSIDIILPARIFLLIIYLAILLGYYWLFSTHINPILSAVLAGTIATIPFIFWISTQFTPEAVWHMWFVLFLATLLKSNNLSKLNYSFLSGLFLTLTILARPIESLILLIPPLAIYFLHIFLINNRLTTYLMISRITNSVVIIGLAFSYGILFKEQIWPLGFLGFTLLLAIGFAGTHYLNRYLISNTKFSNELKYTNLKRSDCNFFAFFIPPTIFLGTWFLFHGHSLFYWAYSNSFGKAAQVNDQINAGKNIFLILMEIFNGYGPVSTLSLSCIFIIASLCISQRTCQYSKGKVILIVGSVCFAVLPMLFAYSITGTSDLRRIFLGIIFLFVILFFYLFERNAWKNPARLILTIAIGILFLAQTAAITAAISLAWGQNAFAQTLSRAHLLSGLSPPNPNQNKDHLVIKKILSHGITNSKIAVFSLGMFTNKVIFQAESLRYVTLSLDRTLEFASMWGYTDYEPYTNVIQRLRENRFDYMLFEVLDNPITSPELKKQLRSHTFFVEEVIEKFISQGIYNIDGLKIVEKFNIDDRDIILFKIVRPKITSSYEHQIPNLTAYGILDRSTLWHAPAEYPQWIQFRFSEPVKMNRLEIMSQENSPQGEQHKRAPKTFKFMGKKNKEDWQELLSVNNTEFETGGQWKQWEVKSKEKYTVFRLVITENNGDPSWLTIHQMRLDYK